MRVLTIVKAEILKVDKVLLAAILISFVFCLYGINWGKVEDWNPDQMVFLELFAKSKLPFHPVFFDKPPFHTYLSFFLIRAPIHIIEKILNLSPSSLRYIELFLSRLLTVFLFSGSVILVFQITKRFFDIFAARIVTLILATSAGFITYSHFLTADIPIMFWMLLACYFSQNILFSGQISDYIWAGCFTGIATATKYNGLSICITIVVAHFLSFRYISDQPLTWKKLLLSKKLFLGLSMVIIGFIIGNPYSVLNYPTFISDFLYNYAVTPVYEGETGHSYWKFFSRFIEILGLPTFLIFAIACVCSLYLTWVNREERIWQGAMLFLLSVVLLYYYKFASFPRLPTRFVLPIVPFWLILSSPLWNKLKPHKFAVSGLLVVAISYNLVSSFYVGKRFSEDPRMLAQEWVKENIPANSSIESTLYSPNWNKLSGVKLKDTKAPFVSGRERLFKQVFKDKPEILKLKNNQDKDLKEKLKWYSWEELTLRKPDYIAIDSLYYQRFFESKQELYPSMYTYFKSLLTGEYPYKIVFDQESQVYPAWLYPQEIDSLHNRITIFARKKL